MVRRVERIKVKGGAFRNKRCMKCINNDVVGVCFSVWAGPVARELSEGCC